MKFAVVLFTVTFLFTSCSDEVQLANDLEGEWAVSSYKVNGDEYIAFFTQFDMEYEDYDKGASEGVTTWTNTDAFSSTTTVESGEYNISEDATTIDIALDSNLFTLNIGIVDDVLTLDGTADGDNIVVIANKK